MGGVLQGFVTLILVIGVGFVIAQLNLVGENGHRVLSRLAFFVASPALMLTVLARTDLDRIFSLTLVAAISGIAVTALGCLLVMRYVFKRAASETVIAMFSAVYVNAGNLGIPIAAYALGSASWIAPILMIQLLLLAPAGILALDLATDAESRSGGDGAHASAPTAARAGRGRGGSLAIRLASQPLRNPMLIGAVAGLVLSAFQVTLPGWIHDPLHLLADMAVPVMLIAYGISLRLGPLPGRGEGLAQVGVIAAGKLVVQPLVSFLMARFVLGLDPETVLAVTVVAALPTAQNVFNYAMRFERGVVLARDCVFVSTVASLPVLIAVVALLMPAG